MEAKKVADWAPIRMALRPRSRRRYVGLAEFLPCGCWLLTHHTHSLVEILWNSICSVFIRFCQNSQKVDQACGKRLVR